MPTVRINNACINYIETGNGDATVILLHCSASSSDQWRILSTQLADNFRVLAPDLYGCGGSDDWPGQGPLTLADEAEAATALMDYCGGPIHLVGHSYGGAVALKAALLAPKRFASLTLIEPVAFYLLDYDPADRVLAAEMRAVADMVKTAVLCGDYRLGMAGFFDYWNGPGAWAGMREKARASLAPRVRKVALDFWTNGIEGTPLDAYRALTQSTLLLSGEKTPAPTRRIAELLTGAIPGAQRSIIAGAGHMAPLTHAKQVNALIVEHLRRSMELEMRRIAA